MSAPLESADQRRWPASTSEGAGLLASCHHKLRWHLAKSGHYPPRLGGTTGLLRSVTRVECGCCAAAETGPVPNFLGNLARRPSGLRDEHFSVIAVQSITARPLHCFLESKCVAVEGSGYS